VADDEGWQRHRSRTDSDPHAPNGGEEDKPPHAKVRTPLYGAKVEPDIFFFGFDLTGTEVKGGTGENPNDDPGCSS